MSRRNKIIIILVVAIIGLLIIISLVWWLNSRQELAGLANVNQGLQIPDGLPQAPTGLTDAEESLVKEPELEAILTVTASIFAERLGSYSNQGNFSNLDALRDLMTVRMKAWVDNYKAVQKWTAIEQPVYD